MPDVETANSLELNPPVSSYTPSVLCSLALAHAKLLVACVATLAEILFPAVVAVGDSVVSVKSPQLVALSVVEVSAVSERFVACANGASVINVPIVEAVISRITARGINLNRKSILHAL